MMWYYISPYLSSCRPEMTRVNEAFRRIQIIKFWEHIDYFVAYDSRGSIKANRVHGFKFENMGHPFAIMDEVVSTRT